MYEQMTIFDWKPTLRKEPEVGAWVKKCGAVIPHIMRPSYIGRKVCIDMSTESMTIYKVGILEDYIPWEGQMRSIVFTGTKQRSLITHWPGRNIYECLPWDSYGRLK